MSYCYGLTSRGALESPALALGKTPPHSATSLPQDISGLDVLAAHPSNQVVHELFLGH